MTLASTFDAEIQVAKDGTAVGGCSIMGLMMLGAAPGDQITITTGGFGEDAALAALTALVEGRFGED